MSNLLKIYFILQVYCIFSGTGLQPHQVNYGVEYADGRSEVFTLHTFSLWSLLSICYVWLFDLLQSTCVLGFKQLFLLQIEFAFHWLNWHAWSIYLFFVLNACLCSIYYFICFFPFYFGSRDGDVMFVRAICCCKFAQYIILSPYVSLQTLDYGLGEENISW